MWTKQCAALWAIEHKSNSLCFCLAAQARKRSLSASLEWAEEALKPHARGREGDAAIQVLRFPSVFWVDRLVLVALGRSSWLKNRAYDRHDFSPGSHCFAIVCIRGRGCCPGRHPLRSLSIGSFGFVDSAQTEINCIGDVHRVGLCYANWITPPLQIDSIRSYWEIKMYIGTSVSIRSDRLAIYFPRPNLQICLRGDSLSYKTTSRSIKKIDMNRLKRFIR